MKLYALHDKKAKAFSSFHVERSDTVASRGFVDAVLQANSVFGKYPDDFELVSLCEVSQDYDDLADEVIQAFPVTSVITARQVVDAQPKSDGQLSVLKEA